MIIECCSQVRFRCCCGERRPDPGCPGRLWVRWRALAEKSASERVPAAQERTYKRFYGLLAQRFCYLNRAYMVRAPPLAALCRGRREGAMAGARGDDSDARGTLACARCDSAPFALACCSRT